MGLAKPIEMTQMSTVVTDSQSHSVDTVVYYEFVLLVQQISVELVSN
jgi:hypothetical protein